MPASRCALEIDAGVQERAVAADPAGVEVFVVPAADSDRVDRRDLEVRIVDDQPPVSAPAGALDAKAAPRRAWGAVRDAPYGFCIAAVEAQAMTEPDVTRNLAAMEAETPALARPSTGG
jgi:hypothetical protein